MAGKNKKVYISRTIDTKHNDIPLYMAHSYGLAVPRGGKMACLCADTNTYSRKCCKGYLVNQGIGQIQGVPVTGRAFSGAFNSAFS